MINKKQLNNDDFDDFDDFDDLDTVLNNKEFNDEYNSLPASLPVSVYDNRGMTIEDISGFPALSHKWDNYNGTL